MLPRSSLHVFRLLGSFRLENILRAAVAALALALMGMTSPRAEAAGISATWTVSAWSGGYTANLVLKNNSAAPVSGWSAQFTSSQQETSVWNANLSGPSGNVYQLTPASWTSVINANGGTVAIGFTFNGGPPETPSHFLINGLALTLNGAGTDSGPGTGNDSGTSPGAAVNAGNGTNSGPSPNAGTDPGPSPANSPSPANTSGFTTGVINFHYYYGASPMSPEDTLTLTGDGYTDLIMSNMVAGVMYGHLLEEFDPSIQYNQDYLYGSIFGQLLQENIATEYYSSASSLIDSSPDQQAVMSVGQGGPYQINNYAADMVAGSYPPAGFSLINYAALQKSIGFTMADAAMQHSLPTPASFNNKFFGPLVTAYFHFNDYRALQYIGGANLTTPWSPNGGGWTPQWQPDLGQSLAAFDKLPDSPLEIILNVAYNAGYYTDLFKRDVTATAQATPATVAAFDSFSNAWGGDSYHQYPYQVRGYLDQLFDISTPSSTNLGQLTTAANHVGFTVSGLSSVFSHVFQTLGYVNSAGVYAAISDDEATTAFASALAAQSVPASATMDLSSAGDRAKIFRVIDQAISNLESNLGTAFSATTNDQL
jgi:hypothetical protein